MSLLKIDLQYFPNVNWFKKVYNCKNIYLSVYDGHTKMSFRNRMMVAGATGALRLSIPIEDGRNEQQLYRDVKMVTGKWQKEHLRTIESCYNRSPWFEYYHDELAALYSQPGQNLFEWNFACLKWVWSKIDGLGNLYPIIDTDQHAALDQGLKGGKVLDISNSINPRSGDDVSQVKENHENYLQVFQEKTGFVAGLSILDLLFCTGKDAGNWLEK